MVKTPTYYVFKMYKVHQDAMLLPIDITCEDYEYDGVKIPSVTASASKDAEGKIHISLCNVNPDNDIDISVDMRGTEKLSNASGEIITAKAMNSFNDFNKSEEVNLQSFTGFTLDQNVLNISLPSKSVVTLTVQ